MHILAVLVGLFSAATAVVSWKTGDNIVLLLAGVGFLCAFTAYQSRTISTFLQIFADLTAWRHAGRAAIGEEDLECLTGAVISVLEQWTWL